MQQVKQVAISCMPGVARERLLHDDHDDEDDGDDHGACLGQIKSTDSTQLKC